MLQMNAACHPASVGVSPPRASAQAQGNSPSSATLKQLGSAAVVPRRVIRGAVPFLPSLQGHSTSDVHSHDVCHSSRIFASLHLQAEAICVGEGGKKKKTKPP